MTSKRDEFIVDLQNAWYDDDEEAFFEAVRKVEDLLIDLEDDLSMVERSNEVFVSLMENRYEEGYEDGRREILGELDMLTDDVIEEIKNQRGNIWQEF